MIALPPYADLLGLRRDGERDGMPVLAMDFGRQVLGRPGFLHGGAISGLLEMAAFAALRTALGAEEAVRIKPVNVTVDFMRAGRELPTHVVGHVSRLGKRIANVEAIAWQENPDVPIAAARMNMLLVRG